MCLGEHGSISFCLFLLSDYLKGLKTGFRNHDTAPDAYTYLLFLIPDFVLALDSLVYVQFALLLLFGRLSSTRFAGHRQSRDPLIILNMPFTGPFLHNAVVVLAFIAGTTTAAALRGNFSAPNPNAFASYGLRDVYDAGNFLNGFHFYTGGDPTHGFVNCVDQGTANSNGLISTASIASAGAFMPSN
jgi:hypothetical protein